MTISTNFAEIYHKFITPENYKITTHDPRSKKARIIVWKENGNAPVCPHCGAGADGVTLGVYGDFDEYCWRCVTCGCRGYEHLCGQSIDPKLSLRESGMRSWMLWTKKRVSHLFTVIEANEGQRTIPIALIDRGIKSGYPEGMIGW